MRPFFVYTARMRVRYIILLFAAFVCASCGSGAAGTGGEVPSGSPPILTRVVPASGPIGTSITIYGVGFTLVPELNFVYIGSSMTQASTYAVINPQTTPGESEYIVATVGTDAVVGNNQELVVFVNGAVSDPITFSVTP